MRILSLVDALENYDKQVPTFNENAHVHYIGVHLKVGVEESIVNAPRITDRGSAV
jgi:hypothetical protein